jgi:hypothetical protein
MKATISGLPPISTADAALKCRVIKLFAGNDQVLCSRMLIFLRSTEKRAVFIFLTLQCGASGDGREGFRDVRLT